MTARPNCFPLRCLLLRTSRFSWGFSFFFLLFFVEPGYEKKGAKRFLLDRLKRLGIPLFFYSFILSPILNYSVEHYGYGRHHSFLEYMSGYHHWIDFGVMWFVAALLILNFIYVAIRSGANSKWNRATGLPSFRPPTLGLRNGSDCLRL